MLNTKAKISEDEDETSWCILGSKSGDKWPEHEVSFAEFLECSGRIEGWLRYELSPNFTNVFKQNLKPDCGRFFRELATCAHATIYGVGAWIRKIVLLEPWNPDLPQLRYASDDPKVPPQTCLTAHELVARHVNDVRIGLGVYLRTTDERAAKRFAEIADFVVDRLRICAVVRADVEKLSLRMQRERILLDKWVRDERAVEPSDQAKPSDEQPELALEGRALALLVDHPDWSTTRIAKRLGCSRSSLYRMRHFQFARAKLKESKADLPSGFKDRKTGQMDAW